MSYKRTLRGFDYVGFEIDADYYQKAQKRLEENRAQNEEKAPSRTSDAFEAIGDDDIHW